MKKSGGTVLDQSALAPSHLMREAMHQWTTVNVKLVLEYSYKYIHNHQNNNQLPVPEFHIQPCGNRTTIKLSYHTNTKIVLP